jgi:hypothetical protein
MAVAAGIGSKEALPGVGGERAVSHIRPGSDAAILPERPRTGGAITLSTPFRANWSAEVPGEEGAGDATGAGRAWIDRGEASGAVGRMAQTIASMIEASSRPASVR